MVELMEQLLELARQPHSCCRERMDDEEPCTAESYNAETNAILVRAQHMLAEMKKY